MFIRREPAVFLGFIVALVQLVSSLFLSLTDEQQGLLNGAVAALAGVVVAALVSFDRALPLLVGLVQSLIAVGLAFGLELDPTTQSVILGAVASGVALFTRTQVVAAAPPKFPAYDRNALDHG